MHLHKYGSYSDRIYQIMIPEGILRGDSGKHDWIILKSSSSTFRGHSCFPKPANENWLRKTSSGTQYISKSVDGSRQSCEFTVNKHSKIMMAWHLIHLQCYEKIFAPFWFLPFVGLCENLFTPIGTTSPNLWNGIYNWD